MDDLSCCFIWLLFDFSYVAYVYGVRFGLCVGLCCLLYLLFTLCCLSVGLLCCILLFGLTSLVVCGILVCLRCVFADVVLVLSALPFYCCCLALLVV